MRTKLKFWMSAILLSSVALSGVARAQGHGHGRHDRDDDDDRGRHYYSDHDRDSMRGWYHDHDRDGQLPPGLAKRDRLPPGLERQLRVRGTLPPGLRKKMMPCPEEVERRLPPPPAGCEHVVIGGHVALVNRSTYVVMDIIHLEL
jgi:Ni/Co efflux regulator RcnB